MGFRKAGIALELLHEALSVALIEENIAATDVSHRHDQAILSLLAYKYFGQPIVSDGVIYGGWLSPTQAPNQKVWVHRRCLALTDMIYFISHIGEPGAPYIPKLAARKSYRVLSFSYSALAVLARPGSIWRNILQVVNRRLPRPQQDRPYDGVRD
jgi:hypothetical protein